MVNLFTGPGSGKSTTAAGVFYELKTRGVNVELATEFAKDLTWEKRHTTLNDQIYVFGKQYHRIFRLIGNVDVVITDSPILLSCVYDPEQREHLRNLALSEHNKWSNYNVFLERKKSYNPKGRNQTESEAKAIDVKILNFLDTHRIPYKTASGVARCKSMIVSDVCDLLNNQ